MEIMQGFFVIGLLGLILYSPYCLAYGIEQLSEMSYNLPISTKLKCMIPVYNLYHADKTYYGKPHLAFWSTIAIPIVIILRVIVWRFFYHNVILSEISILLPYIVIVLWYVLQAINCFIVIDSCQLGSKASSVVWAIIWPAGYMFINTALVGTVVRSYKKTSKHEERL